MKTKTNVPNDDINVYIGNRVKLRRQSLGITQKKLSSVLGVTYQQVQKYENGKNGLSARSLYFIAKFLDVDPSYFYDGYDDANKSHE
jgi:transcriptional regulator with XRE-family HTH domain